jgi:hydroxymethylpyrimidine/phosphomethylpyrimidine kinase
MPASLPCILTIAGSDSSCGAGAQADIKTIAALGGYGLNAITSVVSEIPGLVSKVHLLGADMIADQINVLFDGFPIAAAKTGMLGGLEQTRCVVAAWRKLSRVVPLVVDPVMVATGGGRLLAEDAIAAVKQELLPLAAVVTPNMDEAEVLWGHPVRTRADMEACARDLHRECGAAVLVKGGHLSGDAAADVLWQESGASWFESPRVEGVHTHGTGCSYSAAIATGLGKGLPLAEAVRQAKVFVHQSIAQYLSWGKVHALNHLQQKS